MFSSKLKSLFNFNKRKAATMFVIMFLLAVAVAVVVNIPNNQNIRKKAAEYREEIKPIVNYSPNEVLVKFKTPLTLISAGENREIGLDNEATLEDVEISSMPLVLQDMNKTSPIKKLGKVFKNMEKPRLEITKVRQKFAVEISQNKRKINEEMFLSHDLSRIYKLTFATNQSIDQIISKLNNSPEVEYAEPNYVYTISDSPNDPYFSDEYPNKISDRDPNWNPPHDYQWNIKKTNSEGNYLVDTSGITVAVLDTGVDINHSELGNVWVNPSEIPGDGIDNDGNGCIDDINGCNTINNDGNIADDNNHGTHVAGVISAKTNNNIGIAGITNNSKIMAVKAMTADGYGFAWSVAPGTLYAAKNGARIINISLGGSASSVWKEALDVAVSLGVIPVIAAGNGNNYSSEWFPASYRPGITVGGIDEELNKLKYANYGPNIDVAAPGGGRTCEFRKKPEYCSNILSLKSSQNQNSTDLIVGQKYLRLSGTSMATPHTAGVIALLLSQHPTFVLSDIENYLRFNSIDPSGKGHTEQLGWGVINSTGQDLTDSGTINFQVDYPADNSYIGKKFQVAGWIEASKFNRFEIQYRKKDTQNWSNDGVVLVNSGNSPIIPTSPETIARIGSITLPDNSSLGDYEIKTSLFLSNGKQISSTKLVHHKQKPGTTWLYTGDDRNFPSAGGILTADLDNDGNQEIINYNYIGSDWTKKTLSVYDKGYNLLWQIPLGGEVVVGNIDRRTPEKEVVIQTSNSIYVYNYLGNLVSDMSLSNGGSGKNLMVLDTDNNGRDELIFYYGKVEVFEQNDDFQFIKRWSYEASDSSSKYVWPIAGDLNGDGEKEIVVLKSGNKIDLISSGGNQLTTYTYGGSYSADRMILGDVDRDGKEELVIHIKWGDTKLLKLIGNSLIEIWSVNNSNNIDSLEMADFDGDSFPDVHVIVNNTSSEMIINRYGQILYNNPSLLYDNSNFIGLSALADIDHNGKIDILQGGKYSIDRRQYLLIQEFDPNIAKMNLVDGEWKPMLSQWMDLGAPGFGVYSTSRQIAVTDLDGNGKLDVVITGVGIIEFDTQGTTYWPYKYHDYQRTNSYNFNTIQSTPTPTQIPTSIPTPTPTLIPTPTPEPPTSTPTPTPTLTPTPTPRPVELLKNMSFETDKNEDKIPDSWLKSSSLSSKDTRSDKYARSGKYSFKFSEDPGKRKALYQRIIQTFKAGSRFSLSGWLKNLSTKPDGSLEIMAVVTYADNSVVKFVFKFNSTSSKWLTKGGLFELANDAKKIVVQIVSNNKNGDSYFDDISLVKDPITNTTETLLTSQAAETSDLLE